MITLYHAPKSRSARMLWLLEELGAPYEVKLVDIRRRDGHTPAANAEYRKIHPHGKVPAIVHEGVPIFESAAICLYLGDAFPAAQLAPPIGDPRRGPYATWLAYYTGVMEPAFVGKALGFTTTNSTTGWASTDEVLAYFTGVIRDRAFLLGDMFSTADVLYASTFALFKGSPLLPEDAAIDAYVARCTARPAFARGLARDNG